jgi:hypothetical protein
MCYKQRKEKAQKIAINTRERISNIEVQSPPPSGGGGSYQ